MEPILYRLRTTISACGSSSLRRCLPPSRSSRTPLTVERTMPTASPRPAAVRRLSPLGHRIPCRSTWTTLVCRLRTIWPRSQRLRRRHCFIVWGGAIDVLHAGSSKDVVDAAIDQTVNIERLIEAGATQIMVPNLPPLGAIPRLNGSPTTSVPATEATVLYNGVLAAGLGILRDFNLGRRLDLYPLDVFNLFDQVIASPASYDLLNITGMSQGDYTLNPDTYLFWDDLHPTTRGHEHPGAYGCRIDRTARM